LAIENLKIPRIPALLILNFFFVYIYSQKRKRLELPAFSYLVATSSTMISAVWGLNIKRSHYGEKAFILCK
jgi:hypothetical protein